MPGTIPLPPVTTGDGVAVPSGFVTYAGNAGIKDATLDISLLASDHPCTAAGAFTRSLFAGPSVHLSRRHLEGGAARAIVTVSKNANVATGAQGDKDALELAELAAGVLGCPVGEVLVASTGVIGRPYPMEKIRSHLRSVPKPVAADLPALARAIMTTDTVPKLASARVGPATVAGVAKGSGMIEPDMATMLAYVVTDASVAQDELALSWRRVVERTFNCLSIDTDTSTSDSAMVLANGVAGPVPSDDLERGLEAVCRSLTVQLASDGEGATKLLQVEVKGAAGDAQAKRVAKSIVNSPLVKCAVHGADPNWGRVVMAIGKCSSDQDIDPATLTVSFNGMAVYPGPVAEEGLARLAGLMAQKTVVIEVDLALGHGESTVWGCDLSSEYVHINADYTT
ncbi:MAG TPA: bifunctional glutamate N-acetyltransferase/amino-acid acetyltransferase ArgJ [Acidimicrobiales bacterium]|nr:bifunctional glutamate N-acetyltransferase/amino-acid acetyltransferase ArgJ [Acidimicrobiales bacterium]